MAKGRRESGFRDIRMLFQIGPAGDLTDGQLLERFTTQAGETSEMAFATLVERHGAMVLRVCRSVLRDPHDAHDAFQATFLVLVRRADSLWVRDSLGPWLHQVAYRVASCARSAANRRDRHERRAAEMTGAGASEEERDDLGDVLHEEVNRLPQGCRSAVVLCYFEGLSPEQAARRLGCPIGTVQSRLARGRERLRARLKRRGLAPEVGAMGMGMGNALEAPPPAPPTALVEAVIRAAAPASSTAAASGTAVGLAEGVLKTMFLTSKLRTVAAIILATTVLAAGAQTLLRERVAPAVPADLNPIRAALGATADALPDGRDPKAETPSPPQDLVWKDLPPAEALGVMESLAVLARGNYEKIMTWKGSYSYVQHQYLSPQSVGQFASRSVKTEPLMQEFESVLKFAVDAKEDALYRDVETSRMRFLKLGSDEEVRIPGTAAIDHRSVTTPDDYLTFLPKERATSVFMVDVPEARDTRRAERFPAAEARREGIGTDPRDFFKTDPMSWIWSNLDRYAKAMRGELRGEWKKFVDERLTISKADGPGGVWYRERAWFSHSGRKLWTTSLWSPQAGYNPVSRVMTFDAPEGKDVSTRHEWRWRLIDDILVPSWIKGTNFEEPGKTPSFEQESKLTECGLNQPLDPHQFDEFGLGLVDGDIVLNHRDRVGSIVRDGKIVKLAGFGERSVLKPSVTKPAPAASKAETAAPEVSKGGRIYTTANLRTDAAGAPISSVVAVDPESGEVTKVFDESPGRLRVSPDGSSLAYISGDRSPKAPPEERFRQSLWTRAIADGAAPKKLVDLGGPDASGLPVWSADGKRMIVTVSTLDQTSQKWANQTFRINADGANREPLKIPAEDTVQDWSPDGERLLTASTRNAKIGWQLYVTNLDGGNSRQITEGGNPFYARFSPDGRRVLYSDGTLKLKDRQGVWVVDVDGANRRRVLPAGDGTCSACWSPDGRRIAVAISGSTPDEHGRLEIVDLDGGARRTLLTMPGQNIQDMPDWR